MSTVEAIHARHLRAHLKRATGTASMFEAEGALGLADAHAHVNAASAYADRETRREVPRHEWHAFTSARDAARRDRTSMPSPRSMSKIPLPG
jgi:hypothetical protein